MTIEAEESYCLFHNVNGVDENGFGATYVGGCTKQWLDANDGDPSALFANMGADDYSPMFEKQGWYDIGTGWITGLTGLTSAVEVGMCAYVNFSVVSGDGTYKILEVDVGNLKIRIEDGVGTQNFCDVYVGGAYSDLEDLINEADATYVNCWCFSNSDYASQTIPDWDFISTNAGEYLNNTKIYMVGYKTNAYDALPAGWGYFPEAIGDGEYYKSAFDRGKLNRTDAQISEDLTTIDVLNTATSYASIFHVNGDAENVMVMGFSFQGLANSIRSVGAHGGSSVIIRHCHASVYDYDNGGRGYGYLAYENGGVDHMSITDCYVKSAASCSHASSVSYQRTNLEESYNFYRDQNNIPYYWVYAHVHHNIFYDQMGSGGNRPFSSIDGGQLRVNNNVIYGARYATMVNLHVQPDPGNFVAYNNIFFVDPDIFDGVLNLNQGGTVTYFDYNLYFGTDGNPLTFINDTGANPNWVYPEKGEHDIEADPMFVDAANGDFRPRNPAVITGGRPVDGIATYMGAVPPKHNFKSNARAANFGRLATIRS
jgi:hypothetical protein